MLLPQAYLVPVTTPVEDVGHGAVPFGQAKQPGLADYADGVDTLGFFLKEI
jgi:hypothetical protein